MMCPVCQGRKVEKTSDGGYYCTECHQTWFQGRIA